jgi:hypothetical protein
MKNRCFLIIAINILFTILTVYSFVYSDITNNMLIPLILLLMLNTFLTIYSIKKKDNLLELIIISTYFQLILLLNDYNFFLVIDEHIPFFVIVVLIVYYIIKRKLYRLLFYKIFLSCITLFLYYSLAFPVGSVRLDLALLGCPVSAYTTNFINDRDIDNSKLYRPNSKIYLMNEVAYFKVNKVGVFYISNYYGI